MNEMKVKNIKVDEETHTLIGRLGTTSEDYGDVVKRLVVREAVKMGIREYRNE